MTASTYGIFLCLSVLLLFAWAKTECSSVDRRFQPTGSINSIDKFFECPGNNCEENSRNDDGRTCRSHEHSKHLDAVDVSFEMEDNGDYVLTIKMINPSSTDEDEMQRAKHMAENGAMLLLYGKMLQDMGEKLTAKYQASIYSKFNMPTYSS